MAIEWTREQRRVLDWVGGPLLVLAVAGSGKTTVLLGLIKRLLRRGLRGGDVLMTTFSKAGALDMARRAEKLGVPRGVDYRTLHSVAFEMVRGAGHRKPIEVYKDWCQTKVIKARLSSILSDAVARGVDVEGLPKAGEVRGEIGRAKAALIWPDAWTAKDGTTYPGYREWADARLGLDDEEDEEDEEREPDPFAFSRVVDQCYRDVEAAARAPEAYGLDRFEGKILVSFDDMIALAARAVLRGGERKDRWVIRSKDDTRWKGRYKAVLVDEVQDNNLGQWVLVKHLARKAEGQPNLVAVGDDMQSMYGFRGAMPKLMREYVESGAEVAHLSRNWRSGQGILDTANRILDGAPDRLYEGDLAAGRVIETTIRASQHEDASDEARAVVGAIEASLEAGTPADEISVLYRLNACSGPVEIEMIRRGLRYRVAGASFFKRPIIKAAIGYLAAALDEADDKALASCYAYPLRGLGRGFLRSYPTVADVRQRASGSRWRRGAASLLEAIDGVQAALRSGGLTAALRFIFDDEGIGLRDYAREDGADADDETETDIAADALVACAGELSDASVLIGYARDMEAGRDDPSGTVSGRVTLSTVHKAKGLEWDEVHVIGMSDGLFPFYKNEDQEEERRLAYVAVTRAATRLSVSWSLARGGEAGRWAVAGGFAELADGSGERHDEGQVAA